MDALPFRPSPRTAFVALLLLAVAVRLAGVALVGDRALEYEFRTITLNLLEGRGYDYYTVAPDGTVLESGDPGPVTLPSAYMPPAYPVWLWGLTSVLGTGPGAVVAIGVMQALLGALACALMLLVGRELFDERTGWLAALGFAVYPVLAFSASQVSAAALYVPLFLLFLWAMARAVRTRALRDLALAGALFGLNVLARGEFIAFLPFVLAWLALDRAGPWGATARQAALVTLCAAAVLAPWTVRNAAAVGKATPMTTNGGHNLWQAVQPGAVGTHAAYAVPAIPPHPRLEAALATLPRDARYEVRRDSVYRAAAMREIRADPGRAAGLAARKVWLYWGHFGGDRIDYPGAQSPAFWGPWLLLLPPFAAGLWLGARGAWRRRAFLYVYLAGQTAVAAVFFVLPRYRLSVLPVMLLFAAFAAGWAWDRARGRSPRPQTA